MLRKVTLYGELADKYGKEWLLDINSPREAVKALIANNKDFKQFVSSSGDRGVGYKIIVGGNPLEGYEGLEHPSGRQEIKIVPVVLGAKKGLGQILLGILIIWAAMYGAPVVVEGVAVGEGMTAFMGSQLTTGQLMAANFGASLIMGGVAQMLAPTPIEPETSPENYSFNGALNTTTQGFPVPICYGKLLVGGAVISSGLYPETYIPE